MPRGVATNSPASAPDAKETGFKARPLANIGWNYALGMSAPDVNTSQCLALQLKSAVSIAIVCSAAMLPADQQTCWTY